MNHSLRVHINGCFQLLTTFATFCLTRLFNIFSLLIISLISSSEKLQLVEDEKTFSLAAYENELKGKRFIYRV
jgi:hypothetical protein